MKRLLSNTRGFPQKLATSFLLVVVLLGSSVKLGAQTRPIEKQEDSEPTAEKAVRLLRNYALTTIPSQRTAGDLSKQHSSKHPVSPAGLTPGHSDVPATLRQLLVNTDRLVSYLSFRLSRPGGRAPPAAA